MPKPYTINGFTVLQGERAIIAFRSGQPLGVIMAAYSSDSVKLCLYEGEVYAVLDAPLSEPLADVLRTLESGDIMTKILACELPQESGFEPGETITRDYFVRTDLL